MRRSIVVLLAGLACGAFAGPFGRFGRINDDGLLTLNVTPRSVQFPAVIGKLKLSWTASDATVRSITPTEKTLSLSGAVDGPRSMRSLLTYPGIVLEFGRRARFTVSAAELELVRRESLSATWEVFELRARDLDTSLVTPAIWIMVRPGAKIDLRRHEILLTRPQRDLGEIRLLTPTGIAAEGKADDSLISLGVPKLVKRSAVRVGSEWRITEKWASTGGRAICPVSPVLAFAVSRGYPARFETPILTSKVVTKWGPYTYALGNTLKYRLPAVPDGERRFFGRDLLERETEMVRSLVDDLQMKWATNAVDLGYSRLAPVLMMGDLAPADMSGAARGNLRSEAALRLPPYPKSSPIGPWKREVEPFTRTPYFYTYFISGEGPYRYDIEWGNALPVVGLWQRSKDDPVTLRKLWPAAEKVLEYLRLGRDWAWMTTVNADHGYSTGTGDAMCAAYAGTVSAMKIAHRLTDREAEKRYGLQAAEMAVAMCARFWYTHFARKTGQIGPASQVLGYHETEGFTRVPLGTTDPWGPATLLSGSGCFPEVADLYMKFSRGALEKFLADFERAYPNWFDGQQAYPFSTTYGGNAGYVTFPIWYAMLRLGRDSQMLREHLELMVTNRNHAWVGASALAEYWSLSSPAVVTAVEGAAKHRLWMENETRATVELVPDPVWIRRKGKLARGLRNWSVKLEMRPGWGVSTGASADGWVKGRSPGGSTVRAVVEFARRP